MSLALSAFRKEDMIRDSFEIRFEIPSDVRSQFGFIFALGMICPACQVIPTSLGHLRPDFQACSKLRGIFLGGTEAGGQK